MTISKILTIEEVSELLNVKPSWIYMRTCDGTLRGTGRGRHRARNGHSAKQRPEIVERMPHFKCGRLLRFDRDEILRWFEALHRNGAEPSGDKPEGAPQSDEIKEVAIGR